MAVWSMALCNPILSTSLPAVQGGCCLQSGLVFSNVTYVLVVTYLLSEPVILKATLYLVQSCMVKCSKVKIMILVG
jgi:hypothetical protein